MATRNREILLANVASMYYLEKRTQAQIAERMGYSRSAISRLITEAENRGIVEIRVHSPIKRNVELEMRVKKRFDIQEIFIAYGGNLQAQDRLREVGQLAAGYIEKFFQDEIIIGIGWGTSVFETVNALPHLSYLDVQIIQVIGAIAEKSDPQIDGPELAALLARKLNGIHHYLHSPLILENQGVKRALIKQPQIMETLEMAYKSDITLLGIGTVEPDPKDSSLLRTGYLNIDDVQELKEQGGVANFCGYIIDESGEILDNDINQRVMAVDLNKLRNSGSHVIAIAAGRKKSRAIGAVLQGDLIDTLITDSEAIYPLINDEKEKD
jgi:DNA-binding transcriptional regulator LsrR (DeoR family)